MIYFIQAPLLTIVVSKKKKRVALFSNAWRSLQKAPGPRGFAVPGERDEDGKGKQVQHVLVVHCMNSKCISFKLRRGHIVCQYCLYFYSCAPSDLQARIHVLTHTSSWVRGPFAYVPTGSGRVQKLARKNHDEKTMEKVDGTKLGSSKAMSVQCVLQNQLS